ncbi:MAG: 50S ribosomal protein L4 [Deltaproteobacteria bacterium]|nr:50S ribosomal protein L4 [Deltaproteobacteria bacterium]
MPVVEVYNQRREPVSRVDLDPTVFAVEVKEHLFHLLVRYQLARRRAGTHDVKERSEVSGGGKKPWRQKGSGRARQGTTRAVQWRGGGVVHGPTPRSHAIDVPRKVRRAALCAALTRRVEDGTLWVLDQITLDEIKTRKFQEIVDAFAWDKVLLVLPQKDEAVLRAARNIPGVAVLPVEGLNVYDVLRHRHLALLADAVPRIVERLGR